MAITGAIRNAKKLDEEWCLDSIQHCQWCIIKIAVNKSVSNLAKLVLSNNAISH